MPAMMSATAAPWKKPRTKLTSHTRLRKPEPMPRAMMTAEYQTLNFCICQR